MSRLFRFLAFGRRFSPFWVIWLMILVLPASREPLSLQFLGSSLAPIYQEPWLQNFNPASEFDSFAAAKARPRDLNARLWKFSRMMRGETAGFSDGEPLRRSHSLRELLREANQIQVDFPQHRWLLGLPLRVLQSQHSPSRDKKAKLWEAQAWQRVIGPIAQKGALQEPENAYFPLLEAEIQRRKGNSGAMWRALNRAGKCSTLDTHELEWDRAILQAHQAVRPLLLEEREALWNLSRDAGTPGIAAWPAILTNDLWSARKNGDHRRVIAVGALLAHLGDLMQRGTNTPAVANRGGEWKSAAWNLAAKIGTWSKVSRFKPPRIAYSKDFASYALAHGRADIAARVPVWAARQREVTSRFGNLYSGFGQSLPRRDALWQFAFWRNAGVFIGTHLGFVAVFWVVVNLFLWRGAGAPSTSLTRIWPALCMAFFSAGMGWWCWKQIDIFISSPTRWTLGAQNYAFAVASVALLAFFGPPFLLAVWSAGATLWAHKTQFLKPARIETELRLSPRDAMMLKSGPTILCAVSLGASLSIWLLWLVLIALDVKTLDPLAWLPDDARGNSWSWPQPTIALVAPLMYCLGLNFLGFLLWFVKWRYYSGPDSRQIAHGGLRAWKETLGLYLVIGSAIYLGVALIGWPARAAATRDLEKFMARGELAP